uniref:Corrinoid adenosyltransferase MMAB n=1 Tax=Parastrongyloides trichosuri TaxID=131310 RepID=A0A0N4ZDN6_PARTI
MIRQCLKLRTIIPSISRIAQMADGSEPPRRRKFKAGRGTGDSGKSSLFTNERRMKNDDVFMALGACDELSSFLGICREYAALDSNLSDIEDIISKLQCCLQDLGAHIATPQGTGSERKQNLTQFEEWYPNFVDKKIDEFAEDLPPLKQFILPAGGILGSHLQYARALARNAERKMISLHEDGAINDHSLKFINRMSDLLFVLGRYASVKTKSIEKLYLKPLKITNDSHLSWDTKDFSKKVDK